MDIIHLLVVLAGILSPFLFLGIFFGSVRPRLTRKACSPKTRLFDCAERSNKRVEISLLQRQIDDSVQMCKQAFF